MGTLVKAVMSPTGVLVKTDEIGVGRNRNDAYWLNYIETVDGFYTSDEENVEMFFFPHKEDIGTKFPFSVGIGGNDTLKTILEDYFDLDENDIVHIDIVG